MGRLQHTSRLKTQVNASIFGCRTVLLEPNVRLDKVPSLMIRQTIGKGKSVGITEFHKVVRHHANGVVGTVLRDYQQMLLANVERKK